MNRQVIYTDSVCDYVEAYKSDIIEQLEDNGFNKLVITSDMIYEQASSNIELDTSDLFDALKIFDRTHGRVLALADLGLWNGRFKGGKITRNLSDAVTEASEDSNTLYYERKGATLSLEARHHDGTNYFVFYEVTSKGEDYIQRNECRLTREELHNELRKNGRTRKIDFAIVL